MAKKIIVECKPDEKLVRVLGFTRIEVAHQANKGDVCNHLMKSEIQLALIDEDPNSGQPKHLKNFDVQEEKFGVRKLRSDKLNKTILVLRPRLEEWILSRSLACGIKPETYHLSSNTRQFKDEINNKLANFGNLLSALADAADPGLIYLKEQSGLLT